MTISIPGFQDFISQRRELINASDDPGSKQQYQAEIDTARQSSQSSGTDNVPSSGSTPPSGGVPSFEQSPPALSTSSQELPGSSSATPTAPTATGPGGGPDSTNSNEKLAYLKPFLDKASKDAGVPSDVLAALVLAEGRGVSVNALSTTGVAQCGEAEFNEERGRHPDAFPPDLKWNSPEGQIRAIAFRLADNHRSGDPNWDHAAALYNGGENAGGHLNDPNYINKFHQFLEAVRSGGPIPS